MSRFAAVRRDQGPVIAKNGKFVVNNKLPFETAIHFHGIELVKNSLLVQLKLGC